MRKENIEYLKALGINIEEVNRCMLRGDFLHIKFESGHTAKFKITKNISK